MAVSAVVMNGKFQLKTIISLEKYFASRRVKGILGDLVLNMIEIMVVIQNSIWSAVLLICLKKHLVDSSEGQVQWEKTTHLGVRRLGL